MNLVLLYFYSSEDYPALLDAVKACVLSLRLSDRASKLSSLDFIRSLLETQAQVVRELPNHAY